MKSSNGKRVRRADTGRNPTPQARGWRRGCVQVYTGTGKGKTTAAFGLALRAVGAGLRVFIAQFLKARPSGEVSVLRRLSDRVNVRRFGPAEFVSGPPTPAHRMAVRRGLAVSRAALASGRYDVVILDEILVAVALGLATEHDVLSLLDLRPPRVELVLTGRGAFRRLVKRADLVTDMEAVKHYFDSGLRARKGIEY